MGRRRAAPELIAAAGELAVLRDRERPSGRLLRQGEMDASYVDLADARHLEFDYLRRMRDVVLATGARRVVHVGGAGCALARALASAEPGHRQEVIELDAGRGGARAPAPRAAPRAGLRVRVGDGRAVLARRPDGSADAVLVDAFVGARVPRHLVTAEALADLARVVGAGGGQRGRRAGHGRRRRDRGRAAGGVPARDRARRRRRARQAAQRQRRRWSASHALPPLERLRARAAADRSPGTLLGPGEIDAFIGGAPPWHDPD